MLQLTPLAELLADARIAGLVAVPTPALLIDPTGKLLFANPAGLALIGAKNLQDAIARGPAALGPLAEAATRFARKSPQVRFGVDTRLALEPGQIGGDRHPETGVREVASLEICGSEVVEQHWRLGVSLGRR